MQFPQVEEAQTRAISWLNDNLKIEIPRHQLVELSDRIAPEEGRFKKDTVGPFPVEHKVVVFPKVVTPDHVKRGVDRALYYCITKFDPSKQTPPLSKETKASFRIKATAQANDHSERYESHEFSDVTRWLGKLYEDCAKQPTLCVVLGSLLKIPSGDLGRVYIESAVAGELLASHLHRTRDGTNSLAENNHFITETLPDYLQRQYGQDTSGFEQFMTFFRQMKSLLSPCSPFTVEREWMHSAALSAYIMDIIGNSSIEKIRSMLSNSSGYVDPKRPSLMLADLEIGARYLTFRVEYGGLPGRR